MTRDKTLAVIIAEIERQWHESRELHLFGEEDPKDYGIDGRLDLVALAGAIDKQQESITSVRRLDETDWWELSQTAISEMGPDDMVSHQCRMVGGELWHIGSLFEPGAWQSPFIVTNP